MNDSDHLRQSVVSVQKGFDNLRSEVRKALKDIISHQERVMVGLLAMRGRIEFIEKETGLEEKVKEKKGETTQGVKVSVRDEALKTGLIEMAAEKRGQT